MVQKCILVIDDVEDNRRILQVILEHAGFGVLVAINGREAVEQAQAHCPSLILMDLQMPVMDGWEATRRLKAHAMTSGIPIVAFTADSHGQSLHRLQRAGFLAYLRKPCPLVQVLEAVRRCLAGASAGHVWIDLPLSGRTPPPR